MSSLQNKDMFPESLTYTRTLHTEVRNTVVIGYNRYGISAYNKLLEQQKSRENLIGIIHTQKKLKPELLKDKPCEPLGSMNEFYELVKKYRINHALIAIDTEDVSKVHEIINLCRTQRIDYEFVPELQDIVYGNTIRHIFWDLHRPWRLSARQFVESSMALFFMILFLPVYLFTSLLVKLESPGPSLYSQERVGTDGRIFRIFKFRTMYVDAEKLSGPVLAKKNDPRITKVGQFLRKTRIDEIPQLMNVLIGDMSFIGPRPERPYFVDKYSYEIPMYKNRLQIKPGVTGLAQVTTGYDETLDDVKAKLRCDLDYIDHYNSIGMNLSILAKTCKVVLTAKGH